MFTLALIGLLGGLITGVSPCVLPMLPIIFFAGGASPTSGTAPVARSVDGQQLAERRGGPEGATRAVATATVTASPMATRRGSARRGLRPLMIIAGLVVSFSIFTLVGSTILSLLHLPQDFLRWTGLVVLAAVGVGLIVPSVGHLIERPFYRLPKINNKQSGPFVLGLGLGTLYVPCAGPVLAAITVAGATGQIGARTVVLTLTFAIGASLPLLIFAAAGDNIARRVKAYRSRARTFRVVGGVVMIGLAVALALNVSDAIQRAVPAYTSGVEKQIAESKTVQGALTPFSSSENSQLSSCRPGSGVLASCGPAPAIRGTQAWLNTPGGQAVPLSSLRGKVVLVDFFAYSCINCQRDAPFIKKWYATYQRAGLAVIGVHSPEFAFEKSEPNLASAVSHEGLTYPIVQDNALATWTAYRNSYWPAKYLIDGSGVVRAIKFGEGDYAQTEGLIRQLLLANNPGVALPGPVTAQSSTASAAGSTTPELYLSPYRNAGYYGAPQPGGATTHYRLAGTQPADTWSLGGTWTPGEQGFTSTDQSQLRLHYRATNVYHVLAGQGLVTVRQPGKADLVIHVSGTPNAYPIIEGAQPSEGTVTLTYTKGVQIFTFSFG